jgi:hypothetical protein
MKRLENENGISYSVREYVHGTKNGQDFDLSLRVVERKTDNVRFLEVSKSTYPDGIQKRTKNDYVVVEFTDEEIKFLASAFVEMSAKLAAESTN